MKNFWTRTVSAVVYVLLFLGCIYSGWLIGNKLVGGLILTAFLLFVRISMQTLLPSFLTTFVRMPCAFVQEELWRIGNGLR